MDRGAWQAIVHEVSESDMTEWLTLLHFITIPKKWEREIEVLFFIEECQLIHMEKMILLEDSHFGTTMEKRMATHSSILAWRIPWTEEPGGLQSMGWQRVGHNWVTFTHSLTHPYANCCLYSFGHILTKTLHACYIKSKLGNIQTGFSVMIPCVLSQMDTLFFTVFLLEAHHSVTPDC